MLLDLRDWRKQQWQWRGYARPALLPSDVPRRGDRAEIVRSCCTQFTGLVVKVVGDPHFVSNRCADCGTPLLEQFVEVEPEKREAPLFAQHAGPFYMPVGWLRRIR